MGEDLKEQISKNNMRIYPLYKRIAWDFLFFYTINFLFLTQVKNINPSEIVLITAVYSFFGIFAQIPAIFIVERIGKKKSIVLANLFSCVYLILIIMSKNLLYILIAETISALAFAIKGTAEPSLLNESIPPSKEKSKIYSKLNEKGDSGYFILNALATILSGFLFEINGYIPISLTLTTVIISTIISLNFKEPISNESNSRFRIYDLKESFSYILKSKRLRSLLLCSSIIWGMISIITNYQVGLLDSLNVPAKYIGIIFALLGIVAAIASKKQVHINEKYQNKTLSLIGFTIASSFIIAGSFSLLSSTSRIFFIFIILAYIMRYSVTGIYQSTIERYLRNFTNRKIDTKIFIANNLCKNLMNAFVGVLASILLSKIPISYCMIIVGITFAIVLIYVFIYMKDKVGLSPDRYTEHERKYDEIV